MIRARTALLVVAILAAAGIAFGGLVTSAGRIDAEQQAERFADPLAVLCVTDRPAAVRAGANCPEAEQVARDGARAAAGTDGDDGRDGEPGRGVVTTRIEGDRLLVTYTDGTTDDVGRVVGPAGDPGDAGRGIAGTEIVDGRLVVTYTDDSSSDLGQVVGANGRGVASVAAAAGRLVVTFTDGDVLDAGPLPRGPAGRPGDTGPPGPPCPAGFERVRGALTVGGTTFGSAVVCVDPATAQTPTDDGAGSPAPTPDPTPPAAGDGDTDTGEDTS